MGAPRAHGLSGQLGKEITIVNTGVAGWGPSHYLIKARQELRHSDYEAIVVLVFLGNDVEREARDHFAPKLSNRVRNRLRLPRSLKAEEVLRSLTYPMNDFLETRSHLFMLARERLTFLLMRFGLSARRFHDALLLSEATSPRWKNTADILADIDSAAGANGIPVLFVLLPGVYQVEHDVLEQTLRASGIARDGVDPDQPNRLLQPLLLERGLIVIDTTSAFREATIRGEGSLFGRVDTHLSPTGHQVVASVLEDALAKILSSQPSPPSGSIARAGE